MSEAIKEIEEINKNLPINSDKAYLTASYDEDENKYSIRAEWKEYFIENVDRCEKLAKLYAGQTVWKMINQPNGIDGKNAIKTYNKLMNKK